MKLFPRYPCALRKSSNLLLFVRHTNTQLQSDFRMHRVHHKSIGETHKTRINHDTTCRIIPLSFRPSVVSPAAAGGRDPLPEKFSDYLEMTVHAPDEVLRVSSPSRDNRGTLSPQARAGGTGVLNTDTLLLSGGRAPKVKFLGIFSRIVVTYRLRGNNPLYKNVRTCSTSCFTTKA